MARGKRAIDSGVDLLDPSDRIKPDKEVTELLEAPNERTADTFDLILGDVLHGPTGGYISNMMYSIPVPLSPSYPDELAFDRFYFTQKLLVDFFQKPTSEYARETTEKTIANKRAFAAKNNLKYLPIVGSATIAEIAEIAA